MLRLVLTAGLGTFLLLNAPAQLRRFYSLSDVKTFDTVDFTMKATSGISFVRTVDGGNPLNIFGNPDLDQINPSFDASVEGRTCCVNLVLDEYRSSGFGDGLAYAWKAKNPPTEKEENYWKILLNDNKVYCLNLYYGIGSSDIELGGTHIKRLKINTGSADVKVGYADNEANLTDMDTFMIKVDMGTLVTRNLDRAFAGCVIAEVGFGQATLDFGDPLADRCELRAAVGAGSLDIILPKNDPVIILIKESPLCSINMAKDFEEVEENVYVNMSYQSDASNLLTIRVDVALGSLRFSYSD